MPSAHHLRELVLPLLRPLPPWLLVALLAGVMAASSFYLVAGRRLRSLPTYLILGLAAAPLWHMLDVALQLPGLPLTLGEVDLGTVVLGTWLVLAIARALHL